MACSGASVNDSHRGSQGKTQATESLITSCGSTTGEMLVSGAAAGSSARWMASSSMLTQRTPRLRKSWRTVVSGGQKCADSGMSSKPTMLTSRGTSRPAARKA
jgi:hypothetical protein